MKVIGIAIALVLDMGSLGAADAAPLAYRGRLEIEYSLLPVIAGTGHGAATRSITCRPPSIPRTKLRACKSPTSQARPRIQKSRG